MMNRFISVFICILVLVANSQYTYSPTYAPTQKPTPAFNNIYVGYNLTNLEDNDFDIDLTGIEFRQDIMEEIKDGITEVIQPSPTPTVWYFPDIEHITFSESRKTMDLDLNIEVYWRATDEIADIQRSLIYEDTMEGIFKTYFNTSELQFSVDQYTIRIDDSAVTFQWIVSMSFLGFAYLMFV